MFQQTRASIDLIAGLVGWLDLVSGSLLFLFGFALVVGPFIFAIYILLQLDRAAKERKKTYGQANFRFMIVDFLSLILLVQMPFSFIGFDPRDQTSMVLIGLSLVAILLVWLTTIRTVSQAGISTFGWRALISMILIPTMYMGSFYFGPASLALLSDEASVKAIVWLVVCAIGMVASPGIVRGALDSAAVEPVEVEPKSKSPDPFAD